MPACLSFLTVRQDDVLENHSRFCRATGIGHDRIDAGHLRSRMHVILFKLEATLNRLMALPAGDLLAVMTEDCLVFNVLPLERLCRDGDFVLAELPPEEAGDFIPLVILRNTQSIRHALLGMIRQAKLPHGLCDDHSLGERLRDACIAPGRPEPGLVLSRPCNVRCRPDWALTPDAFALVLGDIELYARTAPAFRALIARHVNGWQDGAHDLLSVPHYPLPERGASVTYNPGCAIGIVLFYTRNIASFGSICETRLVEYCGQHGYTLHVHHDPLPEKPDISGTWIKPFLLRTHMEHHEWVFWLDADILITRPDRGFSFLCQTGDFVLAHDIGPWRFNAGAMGFRNTTHNRAILDEACARIEAVEDRSSTYASGGDQTILNTLFEEIGLTDGMCTDFVGFNTPWFFPTDIGIMRHYYGMVSEYRAMLMHDDFLATSGRTDTLDL